MITQKRIKELFVYKNGELVRNKPMKGYKVGTVIGTTKPKGYVVAVVDGKMYRVHHLVWIYHKGYSVTELDHINRIRNDNRIENLRPCTHSQNLGNSGPKVGEYKGITFCKQTSKWRAQISINYKGVHLGRFNTPQEAARAYNVAAKEHFGEFAYLNDV